MSLLAEFHSILIPFWSYSSQDQCNHSSRIFYFVDFGMKSLEIACHVEISGRNLPPDDACSVFNPADCAPIDKQASFGRKISLQEITASLPSIILRLLA